jgi:hypothetical protein
MFRLLIKGEYNKLSRCHENCAVSEHNAWTCMRKLVLLPAIALPVLFLQHFQNVKFEVSTTVTMKNCVFWDVTPRGSGTNRRFGVI